MQLSVKEAKTIHIDSLDVDLTFGVGEYDIQVDGSIHTVSAICETNIISMGGPMISNIPTNKCFLQPDMWSVFSEAMLKDC